MSEIDILNGIHDALDSTVFDYVSYFFEYFFKTEVVWIVIALILIHFKKTRTLGLVLLIAIVIELALSLSLKLFVDRPRPFEDYEVDALIDHFNTSSFPSGHAALSFCLATVFTVFFREKAVWLFAVAVVVCVTRLYMYAHYPTDVVAGVAIGTMAALYAVYVCLRRYPRTVFIMSEDDPEKGSE